MLKKPMTLSIFAFAIFGSAYLYAQNSTPSSQAKPQAIAQLDVQRYMGQWHEIARLPVSFQKKCSHDITANYSLNPDKTVRVVNTCRTKENDIKSAEALAKSVNEGNSKLKVSFLPKGLRWIPFTKGDYWVLRIDPDYQTVLVGGSSHKYLWILSRQPHIDESVYQDYLKTAQQQGYDTSKLIRNPQK